MGAESTSQGEQATPIRLKKTDNRLAVLGQAQALLQLEAETRRLQSRDALLFHLCNEARIVLGFETAFVFLVNRQRLRIEAASDTSLVEANAPMIKTLERALSSAYSAKELLKAQTLTFLDSAAQKHVQDMNLSPEGLLWIPLKDRKGRIFGGLIAMRRLPWAPKTMPLNERLGETYSHAINAVTGGKPITRHSKAKILFLLGIPAAIAALVFVTIPMTVLAPVEVQGRDALYVTAPLDGVIETLPFPPNAAVVKGDAIVIFEQTQLKNEVDVAQESVLVAAAKLEQLTSGSFVDREARSRVPVAEAELALSKIQLGVAQERFDRSIITAKQDGVVVYDSASDLLGAPVSTGQRLITIVDPKDIEYVAQIPAGDMINIPASAAVKIFMNHAPLEARAAEVDRIGHHARLDDKGNLVYEAKLLSTGLLDRIGSRGVSQISGEDAPLYFVLFRRPLSWLRRNFGG